MAKVVDVKGAYYNGELPPGDTVFLRVPPGLEEFYHPEFDPGTGARNYWRVRRNMPGLRYAGKVWETYYTEWLLSEGFERTNVDRRFFIRRRGDRWLIAAVLVDDSLFLGCDAPEVDNFLATWHAQFAFSIAKAREDVITLGGVNYYRKGDTVEVSCDRLLNDLAALVQTHGSARPEEVPMTQASFAAIREESEEESLVVLGAGEVRAAQTLLGLGGWITANKALGVTFAYSMLASRVTHYLTPTVRKAVLHWANYLVATTGLRLTFRANGAANEIAVVTDSSAHNAGAGKSWGGYAFAHVGSGDGEPTSGAFAVKCLTPKTVGGSSTATELIMATEAKACFGWFEC